MSVALHYLSVIQQSLFNYTFLIHLLLLASVWSAIASDFACLPIKYEKPPINHFYNLQTLFLFYSFFLLLFYHPHFVIAVLCSLLLFLLFTSLLQCFEPCFPPLICTLSLLSLLSVSASDVLLDLLGLLGLGLASWQCSHCLSLPPIIALFLSLLVYAISSSFHFTQL